MAGTSNRFNSNNQSRKQKSHNDDLVSIPSCSWEDGNMLRSQTFKNNNSFTFSNSETNKFSKKSNKNPFIQELSNAFSNLDLLARNNRISYPERYINDEDDDNDNILKNSLLNLPEDITGWFTVFVPNVEDDDHVLQLIRSYMSPLVYYPYQRQFCNNTLRFLIDDFVIAQFLSNISRNITYPNDCKLTIMVFPYLPSLKLTSLRPVSDDVRVKMINVIISRYSPDTKSLDLSLFHGCSVFKENRLFVPLNRPSILLAALNMVVQYIHHDLYSLSLENNHIYLSEGLVWIRRLFPELKELNLAKNKLTSLKKLKSLTGFTIEKISLAKNPLCNTNNVMYYRRNVQKLFPVLQWLDHNRLPSQYIPVFTKFKMLINLGNSFPPLQEDEDPEQLNMILLVESFLSQFYKLYDSATKNLVAEFYHSDASFTISSCFQCNRTKNNVAHYMKEVKQFLISNQIKNKKTPILKKGRENIVNFLNTFTNTKHDLGSFIIDIPIANATMIQIVINGVYIEDFKKNQVNNFFRSFCRSFCIVPVDDDWKILSDILFVTAVSKELLIESTKRFYFTQLEPVNKYYGSHISNEATRMEVTDRNMMELSSDQQPNHPSSLNENLID